MTKPLTEVQRAIIPQLKRNSFDRYFLVEICKYLGILPMEAQKFLRQEGARAYRAGCGNGGGSSPEWMTRQMAMRLILWARTIQGGKVERLVDLEAEKLKTRQQVAKFQR